MEGLPPIRRAATKPDGYVIVANDGGVYEPSIVFSPLTATTVLAAAMHVVYPSSGTTAEQRVKTFWSSDAGATWNDAAPLSLTTPSATYGYQADPVLAFDRTGVAYLSTLIYAGGPGALNRTGIALWKSTDSGRTWSAPFPVVERTNLSGIWTLSPQDDKEWMAIDTSGGPRDGTIYLAWVRFLPSSCQFTRSTDGGRTWAAMKTIGDGGAPQIVIGGDGEIHVVQASTTRLFSVTSHDGGESFSSPVTIAPLPAVNTTFPNLQIQVYQFPSSAGDTSFGSHRGNVYTVWVTSTDAYPEGGSAFPATIWFSRSTDGAVTWSAPRRLSDSSSGRDAMLPSVACDPQTGDVVVAWLDRRDDADNRVARLYAAHSTDGGATFTQPRAFTSSLDLTGTRFIGDYNGTAANATLALTAFSDAGGFMGVAPLVFGDAPVAGRHRAVRH